ncbi:hypothetical protein [Tissierella praeacuta]|uniref:hypothetical protein n=1 Tax=Tissierella praeacuta TaxID=43131 RepID=UPI00333EE7BC
MPSSLAYTRKFIILKKEFSTMAGRNPKGHCKLEIKGLRGMISVNIENAEVDTFYNLVFVSSDKLRPTCELGKIFTDDLGRGRGEYSFTQKELESKNFPIDRISGILIMRDKQVFLGGYLGKEDGSIERYIESIPFKSQLESVPKAIEEVVELNKVEEVVQEVAEINEIVEVEQFEEVEEMAEIEETKEILKAQETSETQGTLETQETLEPQEIAEIQEIPETQGDLEIPETPKIQDSPKTLEALEMKVIEGLVNIEAVNPMYNIPAREPNYDVLVYDPKYDIPAIEPIEQNMLEEEDIEVTEYEEELQEEIIEEIIEEEVNPDIDLELEELVEESMEPDYKTLDHIRKLNQKNQTTNYVLSILRYFPYIEPFSYDLKGYNWWLVELDKENEYRAFLPYFSYIVGGNNKEPYNSNIATCNQLMNKYGHYLFGLYNEGEAVKYFVYGIPGEFSVEEHPYSGSNGFNTWYKGKNTEGYWIIYIDPMTGKAVKPAIPMTPTI